MVLFYDLSKLDRNQESDPMTWLKEPIGLLMVLLSHVKQQMSSNHTWTKICDLLHTRPSLTGSKFQIKLSFLSLSVWVSVTRGCAQTLLCRRGSPLCLVLDIAVPTERAYFCWIAPYLYIVSCAVWLYCLFLNLKFSLKIKINEK